ncbi:MAG: YraN family protein [Acidobacteriaceae bacterium]
MLWIHQLVLRGVEAAARRWPSRTPRHLLIGKRGELEAYLYLRGLGYKVVAGNYRVPFDRGEIDFIAWDHETLAFIEVKTRSAADFAPPATAVDAGKRRHIQSVAKRYLRRMKKDPRPTCRFDVVSVVMGTGDEKPQISLQKGAFSWSSHKRHRAWRDDYRDRRGWRRR